MNFGCVCVCGGSFHKSLWLVKPFGQGEGLTDNGDLDKATKAINTYKILIPKQTIFEPL